MKNGQKTAIIAEKVNLQYDGYKMELPIQDIENRLWYADGQVCFLRGIPGMGKTRTALEYCNRHPESLYFYFQHLDTAFAPVIFSNRYPEIFGSCNDWQSFFSALKTYTKEKCPTIFFDRVGNLKVQDSFYTELGEFIKASSSYNVIFVGRPWDKIPLSCTDIEVESMTMPKIADLYSLKDETAAEIISLTAGIPALLSAYDLEKSFEENVRAMLRIDSVFYRLAPEWMNECFRTPESYNTLLYGMAQGKNRISELSAFSGYPKNKCDKYIKALMEHGLVRREDGKNGHSKYFPANNYLSLWYGALFTAVPNADGSFREETFRVFLDYFNRTVLKDFYRQLCIHWLKNNLNHKTSCYIHTDDLSNYDIEIGGVHFDFAAVTDTGYYAYFDSVLGEGLTSQLWKEIDFVTTQHRPFYKNEYYLLTVNRVPDSFWTLSKQYDNVHIIQRKTLFAEFKKDYNRIAHPKFVPSFVGRIHKNTKTAGAGRFRHPLIFLMCFWGGRF